MFRIRGCLVALAGLAGCASSPAITGLRNASGVISVSWRISPPWFPGNDQHWEFTIHNYSSAPIWWWGIFCNADMHGGVYTSPQVEGYGADTYRTPDIQHENWGRVYWAKQIGALHGPGGIAPGQEASMWFVSPNADPLYFDPPVFFADVYGEWAGDGSLQHNPDGTQQMSYIGNVSAVPEPTTGALLGLGALALVRRRKSTRTIAKSVRDEFGGNDEGL